MAFLGTTKHGEEVEINKRAAESDLIVYVNINLVSMDGGWKSTATGLSAYRVAAPPPQREDDAASSRSFMDRHTSGAPARATGAWARCSKDAGRQGLPDRDHAQQRHVRHLRPDVGAAEAGVGVDRT